jgi:hypothetical protein
VQFATRARQGRDYFVVKDRIVFRSSAKLSTVNYQLSTDLQMLSIPAFPESHHEILQSLANYSDRELVRLFKLHPEQGKFFAALFYRYSEIVYSVVRHAVESQIQADYLFAIAWKQIFQELDRVKLAVDLEATNWQNWLIDITGSTIDRVQVPPAPQIRYTIAAAPPPLWCYLDRGLDRLAPLSRLIVVMTQSLQWNEQRISAYLQGEGQKIPAASIPDYLAAAYQQLETDLPQDIQDIYLVVRTENSFVVSN